jgi:hypothetical protein
MQVEGEISFCFFSFVSTHSIKNAGHFAINASSIVIQACSRCLKDKIGNARELSMVLSRIVAPIECGGWPR